MDHGTFQEIAFKAELNRHEDPEAEDVAFEMCGECAETRSTNIQKLRNMILEKGECRPHRTDDAYLLRFLRARRSIPARAHRLMVRYTSFRESNPQLWRGVQWYRLTKLGCLFEGVLYDRPDVGRLIICRMGEWNTYEVSAEDVARGCLLLLEIGIMQPKLQVLGGTALVDCAGISMSHIRQMTPTVTSQAMHIMGVSFPLHTHGIHVINCSRIFETFFHLFKRVAPADILEKIHFHYSLESLYRFIPPECLPKRYGGNQDPVSLEQWLKKIRQYKTKEFDDEMTSLGYDVS